MDERLTRMRNAIKNQNQSPENVDAIYNLLISTLLKDELYHLLKEVSKDDGYIHKLCSNFEYEIAAKGDVIFAQGDTSTQKFYVIVNGKAGVFIKNDPMLMASSYNPKEELKENRDIDQYNKETKARQESNFLEKGYLQMMKKVFQTDIRETETNDLDDNTDSVDLKNFMKRKSKRLKPINMANNKQFIFLSKLMNENIYQQLNTIIDKSNLVNMFETHYLNDKTQLKEYEVRNYESVYGKCVRTLEVGHYFGEKAIEEQKTRSATIVALANTEFFVLNQSDFQLCVQSALKKSKTQLQEFFMKAFHCGANFKDTGFYYTLVSGFKVR